MLPYLQNRYDLNNPDVVSAIDETPLWSAPFGLKLLSIVRLAPTCQALDIGCGLGFPLFDLALRLGPRATVTGLDPWEAGLDRARQKCAVYGAHNVRLVEGVAENMPFEDATFDLIVSNNGLNNAADIQRALRECHRVARPGAQLVFTMNLDTTMWEFYDVFKTVLQDNHLTELLGTLRAHIYSKRKPLTEIQTLVQESGFLIKHIHRDGFLLRYTDGTAMLNHFQIKLGFLDGWRSVVPDDQEETIFAQIEEQLNRLAEKQGELRLSVPFVTIDCEAIS
jgi:arsenite methyltransferase